MSNEDNLNINSFAVQTHITTIQSIINRMATNSSSCKTWCITLVSAIIVIGFDKERGNPKYFLIASIPIILFFFLDSFYLSIERVLRGLHKDFVDQLTKVSTDQEQIKKSIFNFGDARFARKGKESRSLKDILKAATSISVYPFYLLQVIMLMLIYYLVLSVAKQ
jgi:hypothetical protein